MPEAARRACARTSTPTSPASTTTAAATRSGCQRQLGGPVHVHQRLHRLHRRQRLLRRGVDARGSSEGLCTYINAYIACIDDNGCCDEEGMPEAIKLIETTYETYLSDCDIVGC